MMIFDAFAPKNVHGNPKARQEWAVQQLKYAAKASHNLGLNAHATFLAVLCCGNIFTLGLSDLLV
jgi:hypothetical protein